MYTPGLIVIINYNYSIADTIQQTTRSTADLEIGQKTLGTIQFGKSHACESVVPTGPSVASTKKYFKYDCEPIEACTSQTPSKEEYEKTWDFRPSISSSILEETDSSTSTVSCDLAEQRVYDNDTCLSICD